MTDLQVEVSPMGSGYAVGDDLPVRVLLTNLGECFALAIRQPHTTCDLVAQDPILGHQVLVAQQQFLIDGPRDIC